MFKVKEVHQQACQLGWNLPNEVSHSLLSPVANYLKVNCVWAMLSWYFRRRKIASVWILFVRVKLGLLKVACNKQWDGQLAQTVHWNWYYWLLWEFWKITGNAVKITINSVVFLPALVYIIPIIVAIFNYFQLPAILMLFKILATAPRAPLSSNVTEIFSWAKRRAWRLKRVNQLARANRTGIWIDQFWQGHTIKTIILPHSSCY